MWLLLWLLLWVPSLPRIRTADNRRRRGSPPPRLDPDFIGGNNEIYKRRCCFGPFLVHKLLGSRPPPPFLAHPSVPPTPSPPQVLGHYGAAATWAVFLLLMVVHVVANYWGMRALALRTLNRQRALLLCRAHIANRTTLSPRAVALRERLLWLGDRTVRLGVPFAQVVTCLADLRQMASHSDPLNRYLLAARAPGARGPPAVEVVLHADASGEDCLRALYHAVACQALPLPQARDLVASAFGDFVAGLRAQGWLVEDVSLGAGDWRSDWTRAE